MAYNKIIYKGDTLIDLTKDTVTPETLLEGVTAHTKTGEVITGTATGGAGGSANLIEGTFTENGTYEAEPTTTGIFTQNIKPTDKDFLFNNELPYVKSIYELPDNFSDNLEAWLESITVSIMGESQKLLEVPKVSVEHTSYGFYIKDAYIPYMLIILDVDAATQDSALAGIEKGIYMLNVSALQGGDIRLSYSFQAKKIGCDGWNKININVADDSIVLKEITINKNGIYEAIPGSNETQIVTETFDSANYVFDGIDVLMGTNQPIFKSAYEIPDDFNIETWMSNEGAKIVTYVNNEVTMETPLSDLSVVTELSDMIYIVYGNQGSYGSINGLCFYIVLDAEALDNYGTSQGFGAPGLENGIYYSNPNGSDLPADSGVKYEFYFLGKESGCNGYNKITVDISNGGLEWKQSGPINYAVHNNDLLVVGNGSIEYGSNPSASPFQNIVAKNLVILDGINKLGGYAFYNNSYIEKIHLPNSLNSIGHSAFDNCINLKNIIIPDSVTNIGINSFYNCTNITDIIIPSSVTEINHSAFEDCSNIENITIPFIGRYADRQNEATADSVFGIIFGYSIRSIENTIYQGYSKYYYFIPSSLKTVKITNGTAVPVKAFFNCSMLQNIELNEGITTIGEMAFQNCQGLTNIKIPMSVTDIGDRVFSQCANLTSIVVDGGNTTYHSDQNCIIDTQNKILVTGCKNSVIPTDGSVTSIKDEAFYYCTGLTNIEIPNTITSIGKNAFGGCNDLETITLPFIGKEKDGTKNTRFAYIFGGTDDFSYLDVPTSLKTVKITGGNNIGNMAFYACKNLTSIEISNSVTNIGNMAFADCTGLTSIEIPDSVTSIGSHAFAKCTGLTSIEIPEGVTSIAEHTFNECTGLTSIKIPTGVTSIGESAFIGCEGLTNIEIPNNVTSIESYAFSMCSNLTSVTIPSSITNIKVNTFSYCSSLTDITYNGTMEQWNAITFEDGWNTNTGNYTIHCIDGDIAKS